MRYPRAFLILVAPSYSLMRPGVQEQWLCTDDIDAGSLQAGNFLRAVVVVKEKRTQS
jgi:hypothetical protein